MATNQKTERSGVVLGVEFHVYRGPLLGRAAEFVPRLDAVSAVKDENGAVVGCFGPTADGGYSFCVGGATPDKPLVTLHASRTALWNAYAYARHTIEGETDAEKRD